MSKSSLPLVFLDAGHGGKDPGAIGNGYKEASLNRAIAKRLLEKLCDEKRVRAILTHQAAGKDINETWAARDRAAFLRDYNSSKEKIDYVLSIHLNSSTSQSASGLVVCHNSREKEAWMMYNTMTELARKEGFNIEGNRVEKIQDRPDLAILRASLLKLFEKNGLKIGDKKEFEDYFKKATDNFKGGIADSLDKVIADRVSILMATIRDERSANKPSAASEKKTESLEKEMESLRKKECAILTGIEPLVKPYEKYSVLCVENPQEGKDLRIPALLVETGFISNKEDANRIAKYPKNYAVWMGEGLYKILQI
ncbi:MAG: N-acetylmuramoyl-L-alanine amidase [Candidatus Micrarchaeota archaeon]|nr:N-acetylmuramoyl-L-alanine amidase [Candidatus Micrarchaeota archaeon]